MSLAERRQEFRLAQFQQRTDQRNVSASGHGGDARHRGKPADAAAAGEPDQHRFGLIVERVSGEHMAGGRRPRRVREQPVALEPRRLLQPGRGLASAPAQRAVLDPERAGEPLHGERFAPRLGAQAVVDRDGDELRPALSRLAPARRENEQRGRVRPARDGENENRMVGEIGEQRSDVSGLERGCAVSSGHAFARARRLASRSWALSDTCGPPRRAWRRTFPSASWRPATARAAAAPPAPWRGWCAWWRGRGRPAPPRHSAGAGTGSRPARIAHRRRGGSVGYFFRKAWKVSSASA